MTPRLRPCGRPGCHVCRWRDTDPPDSGHPVDDSLAMLFLGGAAIVVLFVLAFIVGPVL